MPSPARDSALNQRSRAVLLRLSRLPALVVPGLMLVLMLTGLGAPLPFALPALAVVALFIGWLAVISWPALTTQGRAVRLLMLALVLGSAVGRVNGWL